MLYTGKAFTNQRVRVDGNSYTDCTFTSCTLIYGAKGTVVMAGCRLDNTSIQFDECAGETIRFLTGLYHGGFREIVEQTFENIRRGEHPMPPSN
jgi:hypothetical protein